MVKITAGRTNEKGRLTTGPSDPGSRQGDQAVDCRAEAAAVNAMASGSNLLEAV
jgi:hypothetical protein